MHRDDASIKDWLSRMLEFSGPWRVAEMTEGDGDAPVTLTLRHDGGEMRCPKCQGAAKRHDGVWRTWRHLDLFHHKTTIRAQVPRVKCGEHGVLRLPVPWADSGAKFTALFEAKAIGLMRECSLSAAAKQLGVSWHQAAGIQERAVRRGLKRREAAAPKRIGVDETFHRKRHRYVTVVNDLDAGAVLHVAEGRGKAALDGFFDSLGDAARNGLLLVAMDMHRPYVESVRANTLAAVAYDKLHVSQMLSKAIDQVRRNEHRLQGRDAAGLKRSRFLWLRRADSLPDAQRETLDGLRDKYGRMGRAWGIKEWAATLWTPHERRRVEDLWREWLARVQRCRLKPMVKAVATVRRHLDGVVTAVCSGVTNARAESVNAKIQWLKRLANGYRSMERFIMAIMFHLGQLDMRPRSHAIHSIP